MVHPQLSSAVICPTWLAHLNYNLFLELADVLFSTWQDAWAGAKIATPLLFYFSIELKFNVFTLGNSSQVF